MANTEGWEGAGCAANGTLLLLDVSVEILVQGLEVIVLFGESFNPFMSHERHRR